MRRLRTTTMAAILLLLIFLLSPGVALAEGDSLVSNGDFESESGAAALPANWKYGAWYSESADGYAILLQDATGQVAFLECLISNDIRLTQKIAVEENTFYKLTCRVKTIDVEGGAGANVSVEDTLATSMGVYGSTDWQTIELVGKTAKGQSEMTVCVRIGGYGMLSRGQAYFDDFTTEKLESYGGEYADFSEAASSGESGSQFDADELPYGSTILAAVALTALLAAALYKRFIAKKREQSLVITEKNESLYLYFIILGAFLLRCILSLIFNGHPTDINCFMAWGNALVTDGFANFYTSGMFADYPPGYMYVLCLTGSLSNLLGLAYGSAGHVIITKMPGIFADLVAIYVIYRIAKKHMPNLAIFAAVVVAFNPLIAFISGGWGQIDQVLTMLLLLVVFLFQNKKHILAGFVYGIAIIVKPQALMAGPLLAVAYFVYVFDGGGWKAALRTLAAVLSAVAAIYLISLPFNPKNDFKWILEKTLGTATSYPYASVEAFNLFALVGGNWAHVDNSFLFLTYGQWGTIFIIISVAFSCLLYIKGRKKNSGALTLCLAYMLSAIFMLGQYMHERYLFPVLILLLVAFFQYKDKRLFVAFAWFSVTMLLNALGAFVIVSNQAARSGLYEIMVYLGSALNVLGFAYLSYVCVDIILRRRRMQPFTKSPEASVKQLPEPVDTKLRFSKKDRFFCLGITLLYAIVALVNLGTTQAPETAWKASTGTKAVIELESESVIAEIWVFGGLYEGTVAIDSDNGSRVVYEQENGHMFRWHRITDNVLPAKTLELNVISSKVWFNEIVLFDTDGNYIPATAEGDAAALIDEASEVPGTPSNLNGMYFDELYHARTAYEHLNGLAPYENSHPPLGKVFIMLGIAVFGMNAFGWRIVGTLFGIAMVPLMYCLAKRLLKKEDYALLATGLFAFDFMHFTQTRIATIDVYGVFFIMLMFYYMYQYYEMNFFTDGLRKTLKPLALGGLFFGLGAASKWIGIYAGGGLAVILFVSLFKRYGEYRRYKDSADENERAKVQAFKKNTVLTLLWCCVFYIAVPLIIYLLSYLPYLLAASPYDLEGIIDVQKFMFSYHSRLTEGHSFEAPWWKWPLILRPIWYYVSYNVPSNYVQTISAMGNPAVWWACFVGVVATIVKLLRDKLKLNNRLFVLFVAMAANYLPWVIVTRCTFIYHYFATVPFIILCSVYLLKKMEDANPKLKCLKWIWLGAAVLMFIMFYPVISGMTCPVWYVKFLEWLPGWTFLGY